MPRVSLVFALLTGVLVAGTVAQPIPPTATNIQSTTASSATLTLQDLPPGFQELPPEIKPQINARLEPFKQLLTNENISLENLFIFVEPQRLQVVLGSTSMLSNQSQQAEFDASVQKLQQPAARRQLMSVVQQRLQQYQGIKLLEHRLLPQLNDIGDTSTGVSLAVAVQKQPLRVDVGSFRRGSVGAFTAVVYLDKSVPLIPVQDVATKLDKRILQSAARSYRSRVDAF